MTPRLVSAENLLRWLFVWVIFSQIRVNFVDFLRSLSDLSETTPKHHGHLVCLTFQYGKMPIENGIPQSVMSHIVAQRIGHSLSFCLFLEHVCFAK